MLNFKTVYLSVTAEQTTKARIFPRLTHAVYVADMVGNWIVLYVLNHW